MLLTLSTSIFTDLAPYSVVEAAIKAPTLKSDKKTLYIGYDTYKIEFKDLQKSSKLTYISSNSKVATVSSKGVVKPIAKGSSLITIVVKQGTKTYHLKLTTTVQNPTVKLTQTTDYLNIGDTFLFKATVEGMKASINWKVSNSSIININSNGNITAISAGKAMIYAEAGGKVVKQEVTVGTNTLGTLTTNVTLYETTTIWINSDSEDAKELLTLDKTSSKVATYKLGIKSGTKHPIKITPSSVGTDTLTITSSSTGDRLINHVTVVDKPIHTALTSTSIYSKCVPNTVEVGVTSDNGDVLGSGFFIGDGRIVTNYHVIKGASKIVVTTSDKKQYEITHILGYDETLDLAILELNIDHDYLIQDQNIAGGEDIYTFGSPLGLSGTMTKGMVSTASRVLDSVEYIQIDASISHGNSGGPLVNEYGEVVGVNTMYIDGGQNLNFAISIKELQKINTNSPETVAEYHQKYEDYVAAWFKANIIKEDPTVSQKTDTCQEIPFGYGVQGTIQASENGDCYYINVPVAGKLVGVINSDNITDLKNTYFDLWTYSGDYIGGCTENENTLSQYMEHDIKAGEYIIFISLTKGYSGSDINYLFTLFFNED